FQDCNAGIRATLHCNVALMLISPPAMLDALEQEQQRFDRQRRQTYQIVGLLSVVLISIDAFAILSANLYKSWLVRLVHLANNLFMITGALLLIWMLSQRRYNLALIERLAFFLFVFDSLAFNSLLPPLFGQTLAQRWYETVKDDIWLIMVICALAFHLFLYRIAIKFIVIFYSLSLAIVGGQIVLANIQGVDVAPGLRALQVYGSAAVFLGFIYIMGHYRVQAQQLQTEYTLMKEWALVDGLTGVANRRRCEQVLQEAIVRSQRYGEPFTICLWDADHFKQINDTYGHDVGDQVLRQMAQLARSLIRATDTIGRWGGEEFFLLLPHTRQSEAEQLVERLRCALMAEIKVGDRYVTASFGLAEYQSHDDPESLLARADEALYAAKSAGRNRVCVAPHPAIESVALAST
ncbi:GGDEF domain-containing protein, partial [Chloroflexus sp.]|uniref:GGDEF domain-containing protein n=1 Tax=Chloroflexus sp. TaxID=1904827 RepID=UPI002ACD3217